ncbi:hypothetical protein ACTFIW_010226 [Dictyostelium discoideum]
MGNIAIKQNSTDFYIEKVKKFIGAFGRLNEKEALEFIKENLDEEYQHVIKLECGTESKVFGHQQTLEYWKLALKNKWKGAYVLGKVQPNDDDDGKVRIKCIFQNLIDIQDRDIYNYFILFAIYDSTTKLLESCIYQEVTTLYLKDVKNLIDNNKL